MVYCLKQPHVGPFVGPFVELLDGLIKTPFIGLKKRPLLSLII